MPKEITPEHLRCGLGQCPAVYELDDGRVAIRGNFLWPANAFELFGLPEPSADEVYITVPADFYASLSKEKADG